MINMMKMITENIYLSYYYMPVTDSRHFTLNTTVISSSCVKLQKDHKFHPSLNVCVLFAMHISTPPIRESLSPPLTHVICYS